MSYGRLVKTPAAAAEFAGLFRKQLKACNLQPGEMCLVVTDTGFNPIYAAAAMGAALDLGAEAYQMVLPYTHPIPKKSWGPAWRDADLIVYSTTHPLHYTRQMREAQEAGARTYMVMQPLHVLQRLTFDASVKQRTIAGAKLLDAAREIRISSDAGTDLVMDKTGRPGVGHYGAADRPGHGDGWGAGIVEAAELEGTLEGTLVLNRGDICFHLGRYIDDPVTITFRAGRAVKFEGGLDAFMIERYLHSVDDENAFNAGHMAWGTDHRAQWLGQAFQFPEAGAGGADTESFYGNVQIEVGSNNDISFRGKNAAKAHLGLCSLDCSLYLDGQQIIDHGRFVPPDLQ